jgi:hypothetical protein
MVSIRAQLGENPNAKSPDGPGEAYIEGRLVFVTTGLDPVVNAD